MPEDQSNEDIRGVTVQEQINKMFTLWADVAKLPTIGPMFSFSKDINSYVNDLVNLGKVVSELKTNMDAYWFLISCAYAKAAKETMERAPKQLLTKEDFENYRREAIQAFEDAFTNLFASAEFSSVYGKLFSSQLDLTRSIQIIAERNSKALNLPTRSEVDDILRDIAELKRTVRDLKRSIELNDKTRTQA